MHPFPGPSDTVRLNRAQQQAVMLHRLIPMIGGQQKHPLIIVTDGNHSEIHSIDTLSHAGGRPPHWTGGPMGGGLHPHTPRRHTPHWTGGPMGGGLHPHTPHWTGGPMGGGGVGTPLPRHIGLHTIGGIGTPHTHTQWASAGTIIIDEKYRGGQAIVVFFNVRKNQWELAYGKRDPGDATPLHTANRETLEETCRMFNLEKTLPGPAETVSSCDGNHHAFVIRVNQPRGGIRRSQFAANHSRLARAGAAPHLLEMSAMTRINIQGAIAAGILAHARGQFTMQDVYGNLIAISSRDASFIRDALIQGMHFTARVYDTIFHTGTYQIM